MNVALYRSNGNRWAMTERGRDDLQRTSQTYAVSNSRLQWDGSGLTIHLDERAVPHLTPLRGVIRLIPESINERVFDLDSAGLHHWRPIAPTARVEVDFESPSTSWSGHGYFDSNWGSEPLEDGFVRWDWSRAETPDGAVILYDAERRREDGLSLALRFDRSGKLDVVSAPPRVALKPGLWRVRRGTQADTSEGVAIRRSLEDTPFYTREVLDTRLFGQRVEAIHESLDLDRFASTWVRLLLPFRMPRIAARR